MKIHYQKSHDTVLFFSVLAVVLFGLIMIASASALYAEIRFQDQYFFLKRQFLYGVLPGMAILVFLRSVDYHQWRKFSVFGFLISLTALGLVFVPGLGNQAYGATRWLDLGIFSFQPSEMAKLALIVYLSAWLSSKGEKKVGNFLEGFVPFVAILGLMAVFILNQPDLGTLISIVSISVIIFFSAGANISHLASLGVLGVIALFIIIKSASYRWDRLMVFLNPELDPQGKGYQINQALIALGSGGLFGLGLGESRQKFNYLPEPVGDSIFAVIGEELGFIGAICVLLVFALIVWRGFQIAYRAPDDFGKLLALGITSWIAMQVVFNIGAITALLPLTGIPLPFISYGGTSLLFSLAAVGLLLNISRQSVRK